MWGDLVSRWPIIPLSYAGTILFVTAAVFIVALLYDAGARDTGRVTQFGVAVLGIGIFCCLGIGLWDVTVSIASLTVHQSALATAAPMRE